MNDEPKKVLISMRDDFLAEVDAYAKRVKKTRSGLIRDALRDYIKETQTVRSRNRQAPDVTNATG